MSLPFNKGLAYIEIPAMSKAPIRPKWNKKENAITKACEAHRLEDKNTGLLLAYCDPLVAHWDIDNWALAVAEFKKMGIDLKDYLTNSDTTLFTSGRPKSISALYTLPEGVKAPVTKVVREGKDCAFEFRCGTANETTCCSVIPPSTHPSGSEYKFIQGDLTTIKEMPQKLMAFWMTQTNKQTPKKRATQRATSFNYGSETPRKLAVLREQLSFIDPDCDYPLWRDIIWAILSTGYASAYSIARDWSEGAPHRYNYLHFLNTVESFRPGHFTLGTVYHYARLGGWNG